MVRLEKVLYEQLVNTRTFKRERIISAPSKWYSEPRVPSLTLAAMRLYTQGITGQLFKLVEPFFARFVYNWTRDHALQRGLALEDVLVFQDRELRRDPLYEHIIREGYAHFITLASIPTSGSCSRSAVLATTRSSEESEAPTPQSGPRRRLASEPLLMQPSSNTNGRTTSTRIT